VFVDIAGRGRDGWPVPGVTRDSQERAGLFVRVPDRVRGGGLRLRLEPLGSRSVQLCGRRTKPRS